MAELWDLYDASGALSGKTMERGLPTPAGYFHLIVHIWLVAADGSLLIQQRNKPGNSTHGFWAPTAGSVTAGEDSRTGAVRECAEEVGIDLNPESLSFHEREFIEDFIQDVWIAPWDGDLQNIRKDPGEVLAVRSVSWSELMELADAGEFIPYGDAYFRRLKSALRV
jgi:8-oxo-dGTP diphosphatase